ncbi:Protein CBG03503 [Caenorhabditis briggsae]|uniref:Protein CBG03503 n=1 Tax=Caenorhabditis briggsae TaxID=6238 RepID=A8WV92_CAEBR|nr:Protein CBG03503 [Caenorhabditis briggsae]CAP24403.2 Protein CBG03503 [Caenorhabditis briggsae]
MSLRFFLFLLFSVSSVESKTNFHIGGELYCAYDKEFRYQVILFEWDPFDAHDLLDTTYVQKSYKLGKYVVEGEDYDDGQWPFNILTDDGNFELLLRIIHTCSPHEGHPHRTVDWYLGSFANIDGRFGNSSNFKTLKLKLMSVSKNEFRF